MEENDDQITQQHPTDPRLDATESFSPFNSYIGTLLNGRYLIERLTGSGGMSEVYYARDRQLLSRIVAIKIIRDASLANEWIMKKFRQEVEAISRIDHPGIVGLFDAGETPDGRPYFVMQYIDGTNLRAYIKPEGMDFKNIVSIIKQIGRAVGAAHVKGVVHGDLKPENIMLQKLSNNEEHVKILDFGIARVENSLIDTPEDIVAGTIYYMSPEQFESSRLSPESDVFSLGIVAYEMITGRRPFTGKSMLEQRALIQQRVRILPTDLRPDLPKAAESSILRALSHEPDERYSDICDFTDDLAQALTSNIISTTIAHQVFISYSSKDQKIANKLYTTLEAQGIKCWVASRDIPLGTDWDEAIVDALASSRIMILVLTRNANLSKHVKREVNIACDENVHVIPLRVEDVQLSKALSYYIRDVQWFEAISTPLEKHLPNLVIKMKSLLV